MIRARSLTVPWVVMTRTSVCSPQVMSHPWPSGLSGWGDGWSEAGFCATDIAPTNQGACYLIAEGGTPRKIKVAYLSDTDIDDLADHAAWLRRTPGQHGTPAIHVA